MPQQRDSKRTKPLHEKTYEALRAAILSSEILPGVWNLNIRSDNP